MRQQRLGFVGCVESLIFEFQLKNLSQLLIIKVLRFKRVSHRARNDGTESYGKGLAKIRHEVCDRIETHAEDRVCFYGLRMFEIKGEASVS